MAKDKTSRFNDPISITNDPKEMEIIREILAVLIEMADDEEEMK